MGASEPRDTWEKADILLKALLPIAVAGVGYFGTSYLAKRQQDESTAQFHIELLSKREEADSNLRKEMFRYVIDNFLGNPQNDLKKQVLGLELLALNFHDSFDLSPLFKDCYQRLSGTAVRQSKLADQDAAVLRDRLVRLSQDITDRQTASLADIDHRWPAEIPDIAATKNDNFGSLQVLSRELKPLSLQKLGSEAPRRRLSVEVLFVDTVAQTVQLRIEVRRADAPEPVVERVISLSYFDLPALNNIRLPDRERLAVAMSRFEANSVQMRVLHFPETRASLKEKAYLEDLIGDVQRSKP